MPFFLHSIMPDILVYLDESGDLGWKFDAPYRRGGSSRYLTISSLIVAHSHKHHPKRLVKGLYNQFSWPQNTEKKWSDMNEVERITFAQKAAALKNKLNNNIKYMSITVKKENVQLHIRSDQNILYNYMISLSLINEISRYERVSFLPDQRSIKLKRGNSLHDYIQTNLWFEKHVSTVLNTVPSDSSTNLNVQFADMLAGVVQGHFEDGNSQPWQEMRYSISYKRLFF